MNFNSPNWWLSQGMKLGFANQNCCWITRNETETSADFNWWPGYFKVRWSSFCCVSSCVSNSHFFFQLRMLVDHIHRGFPPGLSWSAPWLRPTSQGFAEVGFSCLAIWPPSSWIWPWIMGLSINGGSPRAGWFLLRENPTKQWMIFVGQFQRNHLGVFLSHGGTPSP